MNSFFPCISVFGEDPDFIRDGSTIPVARMFQTITQKSVMMFPIGAADDGEHSQKEKISRFLLFVHLRYKRTGENRSPRVPTRKHCQMGSFGLRWTVPNYCLQQTCCCAKQKAKFPVQYVPLYTFHEVFTQSLNTSHWQFSFHCQLNLSLV